MNLKDIKRDARESLKGNWGMAIGAWLVTSAIPLGLVWFVTPIFGFILGSLVETILDLLVNFLIGTTLGAGFSWLFLGFVDQKKESFGNLFNGFKYFGKVIGTALLVGLILGLWALAFMVPAIVVSVVVLIVTNAPEFLAPLVGGFIGFISVIITSIIGIRYAMVMYSLKDTPWTTPTEALRQSKELMKGRKWSYFLLQLQFMVWYIPGLIALIGAVWFFIRGIFPLLNNPFFLANPEFFLSDIQFLTDASIIIAVLLLFVAGLYWFGISFYVSPYRQAASAVFYRRLVKPFVIEPKPEMDEFVFANNTPPKEPVFEDVLVKEDNQTFAVPE